MGEKMRIRMLMCFPVMLLTLGALHAPAWGQGSSPSIFITSGSKTDQPAKSGQASDEATAASHYLADRIAIELQNQYPCASITEDRDIAALLKWEHDHSLLDPNYESDLANVAGSVGARYLISVTATQVGGQIHLQASCMNTRSVQTLARAGQQATAQNAIDKADSLARDFAKALGHLFAVKPESGQTYPIGTVLSGVVTNSYKQHVLVQRTGPEVRGVDPRTGRNSGFIPGYFAAPDDWGSCGGCRDCSCSGTLITRLTIPGRYRVMQVTKGVGGALQGQELIAEFTIEGSCKK
jgi:hypothetical protein